MTSFRAPLLPGRTQPNIARHVTGRYYGVPNAGTRATQLMASGTLYFVPFLVPAPTTYDRIGLQITTGGSGGSVVRFGIHYDDPRNLNRPGDTLLDAGTASSDVAQWIEATISQYLYAGLWWVSAVYQVGAGAPTMRATIPGTGLVDDGTSTGTLNTSTAAGCLTTSGVAGALPVSNTTISSSSIGPHICLRAV